MNVIPGKSAKYELSQKISEYRPITISDTVNGLSGQMDFYLTFAQQF